MLFVALIGALATPSPLPSPAARDLPEIGRVRSSFICSVLRERVAPALLHLNRADRSLEAGKNDFLEIGRDQTAHLRAAVQLGQVKVENEVGAMVNNLAAIETLLSSTSAFPSDPQTEDGRTADDIRAHLQAVMSAQQVAINALNGTIETERLGQMQTEGLNVLSGVVGPERAGLVALANGINADEPVSYFDLAGLPATSDLIVDPRRVEAAGLVGNTVYGKLATALYGQQIHISQLESELTAAVVPLERSCRSVQKGSEEKPKP